MSSWNPQEANDVNPPPCHNYFHIQVENNKLNLILMQRSCDLFLGVPFNIAFYSLFLNLLAMVTDKDVGVFSHHMGDYHIYLNHKAQCQEQVEKTPYEPCQIVINERLKGKGLEGLLSFRWEDVSILNYKSHESLKGKMSV